MLNWILNNHFFPLRAKNLRFGHIIIYLILFFIILLHIAFTQIESTTDDLYLFARYTFNSKLQAILHRAGFSRNRIKKKFDFSVEKNKLMTLFQESTPNKNLSKSKTRKLEKNLFKTHIKTIINKFNQLENRIIQFNRLRKNLNVNGLSIYITKMIDEYKSTAKMIDRLSEYKKNLKLNDLKATLAKRSSKFYKLRVRLKKLTFTGRNNNLWVNLFYYKNYSETLQTYFRDSNNQPPKSKLPKPKYPLISFILKPITGTQSFPPINLVEIASFLRKNLGSGITIRTKDYKIGEQSVSQLTNRKLIMLLNQYKDDLSKSYKIVIEGKIKKKPFRKPFLVNFKSFPNFINHFKRLFKLKVKLEKISLYKTEKEFRLFKHKKKSRLNKEKLLLTEYISHLENEEIIALLKKLKAKTAIIYTIVLDGKKNYIPFQKKFLIRFDDFPSFDKIISQFDKDNISFQKITLYQSTVLKYRANSREFVDFNKIPDHVRKAFILVEDDYFYFQAGGIDPIGLIKASYNYVIHNSKRGNASIIEQIYEMYLGQQRKNPFDKFVQLLGAVYYSYYSVNRDPYVNLYVQSIPGSFWGDHNYGIKGIIKNYLNRDSIKDIKSWKKLAWLTRIALSPNISGLNYVRFQLDNVKEKLKGHEKLVKTFINELKYNKIDIFSDREVKQFLKKETPAKQAFLRLVKGLSKKTPQINDAAILRLIRLKRSYDITNNRINVGLQEFYKGNEFVKPLISLEQYQKALTEEIQFESSSILNKYQSYTDQTKKDITQFAGYQSFNAGLDIEVDFDERAQRIIDEQLRYRIGYIYKGRKDDAEPKTYGGAAILVKTHNIKTGKVVNKIVAIASKHTEFTNYFNWAVDGKRHFGSIFKWIALLLYLDGKGTLLDTLYDIPRTFEYKATTRKGKVISAYYSPDNWRIDRDDPYGFYTYRPQNNVYNFLQSKNNTFVKIANLVGIQKISRFLNQLSGLNTFSPLYPIVLGSQELSSVRFAQINAIISNWGIYKPLTTINRLIEPDGSSLILNLEKKMEQVVSREAAEASLFCGYLNTYFGTAKRFIKGGVGKTGSSDTDISFLAMTARTEKELIDEKLPADHLLAHNLLYLVNIGVNKGKIDDGLYGGRVGAPNAKDVFEELLEYRYVGKVKKPRYKISGDFTKYFSKNKFNFKPISSYRIKGRKIKVPVLKDKKITHYTPWELTRVSKNSKSKTTENGSEESSIEDVFTMEQEPEKDIFLLQEKEFILSQGSKLMLSLDQLKKIAKMLDEIKAEYEIRKDIEFEEELAEEFARADGIDYQELTDEEKEEYKTLAIMEAENKKLENDLGEETEYYDSRYKKLKKNKSKKKKNRIDKDYSIENYLLQDSDYDSVKKKRVIKIRKNILRRFFTGTLEKKINIRGNKRIETRISPQKRYTEKSFLKKLEDETSWTNTR